MLYELNRKNLQAVVQIQEQNLIVTMDKMCQNCPQIHFLEETPTKLLAFFDS